jgi:transposase
MNLRETKGQQIAHNHKITQSGNLYLVPSQSGKGKYKVNPQEQTCSCPDYDFRRQPCKHLYAVQVSIRMEKTTVTENGKTTVTETLKVTQKQTYRQEWPAYNKAQTNEKRQFQYLLHQLCQGVGEPAQMNGRPRLPLEDMIFAMAFKVYSTVSGRRFMSDMKDAHARGYTSKLPAYNTIFKYFESEMLTPYLQMLIEESALPLQAIERDFAVDSSGFGTSRFESWMHAKYSNPHMIDRRMWLKAHLICGVKTNIVTSVEITDSYSSDCNQFKPLVEATAANFVMNEVSADKAYLSEKNLQAVVDNNAMPFIPFKVNSATSAQAQKRQSPLWKSMYHYFSYNTERFMSHYHKRSNVETTFHMIKAKFGTHLRSKTVRAQINEALLKVLCHNICCLIQAMYELGLKPKFYAQVA